ncbi:LysR family transcriptional regulator, partial [Azospirillum brasilense]|nr:LysR family transcriptional regulator [Azospirillum brasilense]
RQPGASPGGGRQHGSGTAPHALGQAGLEHHPAVERDAFAAAAPRLEALEGMLNAEYGAGSDPADDGSFSGDPALKPGCKPA